MRPSKAAIQRSKISYWCSCMFAAVYADYRSLLFESYRQICYAWTGKEALGVLSFVRL